VTNPVDAYAIDVLSGRVPAGKYHRLACERHRRDRAREGTAGFPFVFRWDIADRFVKFSSKLKHYKGEWAGRPIALQPYQLFRLGSVFGWIHPETGLRRFRTAYNELPRKQGKSLEAALVALYVTFFDGEPGAEGYCSATKRDQAKIVFADCKKLVQSSGLKSRIKVLVGNLHHEGTASKLEPLGADHDSTDGLNPHLVIVDEFHAHKDRGLIDVLETATGARRQPLTFQITTAGNDPVSPCGDQHEYCCKILDGLQVDETFFGFIAHLDPGDDWLDERSWAKANPNYGVSVNPEDMRALATKARAMPNAASTFRQKRLNEWVNADTPWLSMHGWRTGQTTWSPAELEHETCYIGIDLASKIDLCAMVALFPPQGARTSWRGLTWAWTPEDGLVERARRDRAPYDVWRDKGFLRTTPGARIDHNVIRRTLRDEIKPLYHVAFIGFDPWHADKLITELVNEDGYDQEQVVGVAQTYAGMSNASLHFEADVLEGLVDFNGNPLMAWCVSNAVVQRDGKDNIYPVKKRSNGRIDPVMAAIVARRGAAQHDDSASVYLTQGVRTLGE
jgi:phage terminase large subunit-like protein